MRKAEYSTESSKYRCPGDVGFRDGSLCCHNFFLSALRWLNTYCLSGRRALVHYNAALKKGMFYSFCVTFILWTHPDIFTVLAHQRHTSFCTHTEDHRTLYTRSETPLHTPMLKSARLQIDPSLVIDTTTSLGACKPQFMHTAHVYPSSTPSPL